MEFSCPFLVSTVRVLNLIARSPQSHGAAICSAGLPPKTCPSEVIKSLEKHTDEVLGGPGRKKHNLKARLDGIEKTVIKQLEITGEASRGVSVQLRGKYPDIPWRQTSGIRGRKIHDGQNQPCPSRHTRKSPLHSENLFTAASISGKLCAEESYHEVLFRTSRICFFTPAKIRFIFCSFKS